MLYCFNVERIIELWQDQNNVLYGPAKSVGYSSYPKMTPFNVILKNQDFRNKSLIHVIILYNMFLKLLKVLCFYKYL